MLKPSEAEGHPDSNVITRAVGVRDNLRVETIGGDARPGDIFLIASDGLTRPLEDEEMYEELTMNPPDVAAGNLLDMVMTRGAPDNVSFVIVRVN